MPIENDTPTLEGATNVSLHQRSATPPYDREVVNIQGDANQGRAIGFNAEGRLTTLLVSGEGGSPSGPIELVDMAPLPRGVVIGRKSSEAGVPEAVTVAEMIALDVPGTKAALGKTALSDMANLAQGRLIGRSTAGTATPEAVTVANMIALDVPGTKSALGKIALSDMADLAQRRLVARVTSSTGVPEAVTLPEVIALDPAAARAALGISESHFVVVDTAAELVAAVAAGGHIIVLGPITLAATLNINVADTHIYGGSVAGSSRAKLILPGVAATAQAVVKIRAPRVELHGLEITANNPLTPLTFNPAGTPGDLDGEQLNPAVQRLDYGVFIDHDAADTSDFVITGCYIHHVTFGVGRRNGSRAYPYVDRGKIVGNRIESFNWFGIYIDWCTRDLLIAENWIWGRARGEQHTDGPVGATESHPVPGNAIWVGNYAQRCLIRGNDCGYCDRHGIEIVNTHDHDASANDANIVVDNSIHDLRTHPGNPIIRRSMGISVACGGNGAIIANNQVRNTTFYGIEVYCELNTLGNYVIHGNHIENVIGDTNYNVWGISVNSSRGAIVTDNYVKRCEVASGATVDSVGIEIAGGAATQQPGPISYDSVTVANNELVDAGNYGICATCAGSDTATCLVIRNNTVRITPARQYRPTSVAEIGIVVYRGGTSAVVKDNVFFHPTAKPPAGNGTLLGMAWTHLNGFDLIETGTVYSGHAADAAKVGSAGTRVDIGGSNLSIAF